MTNDEIQMSRLEFCHTAPGQFWHSSFGFLSSFFLRVSSFFHFPVRLLGLFALVNNLQAHDPGLSAAYFTFDEKQLVAHLSIAESDLQSLISPGAKTNFAAIGQQAFKVTLEKQELPFDGVSITNEGNAVEFTLTFARAKGTNLVIRSLLLTKLPRGHRQYLALRGVKDTILDDTLLDASNTAWETRLPVTAATEKQEHTFARFLRLGIDHILTGYDHLAFLLGLLIVGVSLREAAKIITAFTLAHSLTLALATLNVIRLSPRIVEPLIAVSIVYVGLENIFRRDLKWRWV